MSLYNHMKALLIPSQWHERGYYSCLSLGSRRIRSARSVISTIFIAVYLLLLSFTPAIAQAVRDDTELAVFLIAYTIGAGLLIAIPIFIAFYRKHPNRWVIFVITIIFGATGLGWLIALVWSLSAVHLSPKGSDGGESGLNLFVNDNQQVEQRVETDNLVAELDAIDQLQKLKSLLDDEAITVEEYAKMKAKLLG